MSLPLRWTEGAVSQLASIAEYISVTSPVYAEAMIERIVARLALAQAHPLVGRHVRELRQENVRELVEPPYRLVYRAREECIEVLAIVHGRQDRSSGE